MKKTNILFNKPSFYDLYKWSQIVNICTGLKPVLIGENFNIYKREKGLLGPRICQMPFGDYTSLLDKNLLNIIYKKYNSYNINLYSNIRIKDKFFYSSENNVYFVLTTHIDYDYIFKNNFHKKTRNMVRKVEKKGVLVKQVYSIGKFYDLYLDTMQKLGAIPIPKTVYEMALNKFKKQIILLEAKIEKTIIGYLWAYSYEKQILIWANVTYQNYLNSGCNYALYNEIIKIACKKKDINFINFGSSLKNSPQAFFKSRWGGKEKPIYLYTNYVLAKSDNFKKNIIRKLPIIILKFLGEILYRVY